MKSRFIIDAVRRAFAGKREMDLTDASLVWLAAETDVTVAMTLEVRDCSHCRLPDGRAFEIL